MPVRAPALRVLARGMVYLALGPAGRRDCDEPRRRGGRTRCDETIDSMSRDAAWIHGAVLSLGRTARRRPHAEELGLMRTMYDDARNMVVRASGCGCPAARTDAEALLSGTREAADAVEGSAMPAWMSLGDQRIQQIARLAEHLERAIARCPRPG